MIVPDTKNWTFVLERRCEECGVDTRTIEPRAVPDLVRAQARAFCEVLARDGVRRRPRPDRWSPLEYGCHVRDVFAIFDRRVALIVSEDDPTFANWDQDATAIEKRYGEQDPAIVAGELSRAAERLARRLESCGELDWQRTGGRSDGARFSLATLARYLAHDPAHHLVDVGVHPPAGDASS